MNKKMAKNLDIKDGDWVSISTRRGTIKEKANLVDWICSNVIEVGHGWWFPEKGFERGYGWKELNINVLLDNKPFCSEMDSPSMRGVFCKLSKREYNKWNRYEKSGI